MNNMYTISDLDQRELMVYNQMYNSKKKETVVAWLLWVFLGSFGAERFYIGERKGLGIAQAIMSGLSILTLGLGYLLTGIPIFVIWIISAVNINGDLAAINGKVEQEILASIITSRDGKGNKEKEVRETEKEGIDKLERLSKLKEQGALSEEEFETKKKDILEKL